MSRHGPRVIGLTYSDRPIFEPLFAGSSLTLAAAGGGKTTCVAMPTIMSLLGDPGCAIGINDVKAEIAPQIAPLCTKYGRPFGVVDVFHERPELAQYRISLNPFGDLAQIPERKRSTRPYRIENISHALIEEPKDDAKNFYWRESPRTFLETGINILLDRVPRMAFPGGLHALLSDPQSWKSALEIASEEGEDHVKAAAIQILEMQQHNPEHYAQHLGAALTALKSFATVPLKDAGRAPTLTYKELIEGSWIVCFVVPAYLADRLGSFYALTFLALLNEKLAGAGGRMELILDEFCNAPLRDALNRVTIQRAYDVRSHFLVQSRQDIVRRYGEKETAILMENVSITQYLKFSSYEEAERVSRAMGERLIISRGLGVTSDRPSLSGNYSVIRHPIMTADELMRLPPDEQIIHIAGFGFIRCKKIRQNQCGPYSHYLGDNPREGAAMKPDPKVWLPVPARKDAA